MMIKGHVFVLLILLVLSVFGCVQENPQEAKIIANINGYRLPLDQFQHQLATELEMDDDFKLTNESKKEFLEELIKKELLIQEAKRMGLDRREKFRRTIERYWESTLIRDLVDLKGTEIDRKTYVSQEEIEAYYSEMKETEAELPSLTDMEAGISRDLKEKKKSKVLREWILDLRNNANVEVNEALLSAN